MVKDHSLIMGWGWQAGGSAFLGRHLGDQILLGLSLCFQKMFTCCSQYMFLKTTDTRHFFPDVNAILFSS